MKELSIEEKAKRYDEALEKARQLCAYPTTKPFISDLQDLFPELEESENERVREELIDFVKSRLAGFPQCEKYIAWIENQGEQKHSWSEEDEHKVKDAIYFLATSKKHYASTVEIDACIDWLKSIRQSFNEEKVNNANKVEPKFKVGDFIANDYCRGKVVELTNDAYLLDTGQGIPFSCEHNIHLWTIEDAKDGDVLVEKLKGE